MSESAHRTLSDLLTQHDIALSMPQVEGLDRYCQLVWAWNRKLNLTRHTDFERFVTRDIVDCLELSQLLAPGEEVLDVGSGGGVPGVVLGLLRTDLRLTLAESVGKKAHALSDIVAQLGLEVPVFAERAEDLLDDLRFDSVIARAVGPLWKMLKWFAPHWTSIGRLLAVKGPRWIEERAEARHRGYLQGLELRRVAQYTMPGTGAESVILQVRKPA